MQRTKQMQTAIKAFCVGRSALAARAIGFGAPSVGASRPSGMNMAKIATVSSAAITSSRPSSSSG